MEIAKSMKCSVCEKFRLPRPARAAAPPKEIGLNEIVGIDTIQLRAPFSNKTKYCINIVDYSSHFQLVVPLTGHTAEATRAGYRLWLKIFGAPRKLLCDLGREFQKLFETLAEADGSELLPSSLETPEQRGFVERHGQLFKDIFYKTIEQTKCSTWDEWYQTIDLACSTKNRLSTRGGYSPAQRVFGYQQRIPGGLMSEAGGDLAVQSLAASGDVDVTSQPFTFGMVLPGWLQHSYHPPSGSPTTTTWSRLPQRNYVQHLRKSFTLSLGGLKVSPMLRNSSRPTRSRAWLNFLRKMMNNLQRNDKTSGVEKATFGSEFINFGDRNSFVLIVIFPSCLSTWTSCCHGERRSWPHYRWRPGDTWRWVDPWPGLS